MGILSSKNKVMVIVLFVIIIGIIAAAGYKISKHHNQFSQNQQAIQVTNPVNNTSSSISPTGNQQSPQGNTRNTSLDQQAQSIQNSMNQLSQDQTTAGQTLNKQSSDIPQQ